MLAYVARRLIGAIPLVLGIATVIFFILSLAPGDPTLLYTSPDVSPDVLERMRRNLGLDQPVHVRYVRWLAAFLTGDFGVSFARSRPVAGVILEILPNTLLLSGCALLIAFVIGIVLGVIQAVRQYSLLDSVLSVGALFFYSMPSFWLALMLILVFALHAKVTWGWPIWFPPSGMTSVDHEFLGPIAQLRDRAAHLFLPAMSLVLMLAAGVARYTRSSMLEVIRQDYVRTARAKGVGEVRVIFKHALRNAVLPVVTLLGLYLPFLFSGAVFVETVFAWPGMGRVIVEAVSQRDYPVVMAVSFVFAVMVVLGNLLADVLYAVVDPRIRYE